MNFLDNNHLFLGACECFADSWERSLIESLEIHIVFQAREKAQRSSALSALPEDPRSIPRTHVKGDNSLQFPP